MMGTAQANGTASHQRGLELFQSGNYDQAAAEFTRALRCDETPERWNDWASVQYAMNHAEEAERGFRRALDLDPEYAQAAANLAVLLSHLGRKEEATALLERSRDRLAAQEQEVAAKLIAACKSPQTKQEPAEEWNVELEQGLVELNHSHNLSEARRRFERACAMNPQAGIAWFFHGATLFRLSQFDAARQSLQKAELCGHRTALSAQMRGDSYYNLGFFTEARAAYQTALNREPRNSSIRARLGLTLVRAGFAEMGLKRLRADLAAMPQASELYEGLILSHMALGQNRAAVEVAERKLTEIPDTCAGDYLRAASLWAELQESVCAKKILEKGLAAFPEDANLKHALQEARNFSKSTALQIS